MDFVDAAQNCGISVAGNPGVIPRNRANKRLFENAYLVSSHPEFRYSPDVLYYPKPLMYGIPDFPSWPMSVARMGTLAIRGSTRRDPPGRPPSPGSAAATAPVRP